ncbi:MAG: TRAP transporter small permease subunit [Burkholderiales bacterium]|nr:TRAP transporter small permease subunit [Rhodocyclaceae bacterium]
MQAVFARLLAFSDAVDRLNQRIGRIICWLVLAAVLVSAGNAVARYAFKQSSNAWLELQWYLIAAVFLLCAGYTLLKQQHVRIDVVYSRFSRRTQLKIDIFGTVFFLMPISLLLVYLSWPVFVDAFRSGEVSGNTGGLPLWWARLLVPIGFTLLSLQGLSELIKRVAILRGDLPDTIEAQQTTAVPTAIEGQAR